MIGKVLQVVVQHLNAELVHKLSLAPNTALLKLESPSAAVKSLARIKEPYLSVQLLSINTEKLPHHSMLDDPSSGPISTPPPLHYHVYCRISALSTNDGYPEAINYLTGVLESLHKTPLWDRTNTPTLPDGIERITFEEQPIMDDADTFLSGHSFAVDWPSCILKLRVLLMER